jgi:hypothetical protein
MSWVLRLSIESLLHLRRLLLRLVMRTMEWLMQSLAPRAFAIRSDCYGWEIVRLQRSQP